MHPSIQAAQGDRLKALLIWKIIWFLSIASVVSFGIAMAQIAIRPAPPYLFFPPNTAPINQQPGFDKPFTSAAGLLQWATSVVVASRNFSFANVDQVLESQRSHFSKHEFAAMKDTLENSGAFREIIDKHLVQTCVPTGPSIISGEGVINHQQTWRIQFPILVSYQGSRGVVATSRQIAIVDVSRADTRDYPAGFVISRMSFQQD